MTNAAHLTAGDSGLNLDNLEALCSAAARGPWVHNTTTENTDAEIAAADGTRVANLLLGDVTRANSAFIAAANPAAVQELIALARRTAPVSAPTAGESFHAAVRALMEKWHNDAVEAGFGTSEAAVELDELLSAHQPAQEQAIGCGGTGKCDVGGMPCLGCDDCPAQEQAKPVPSNDYVLMPRRLTAENGAKGLLLGEFVESFPVACHECDGVGEVDDGYKCSECGGEGQVEQRVAVEWDTIKRIYSMAVAHLAAPSQAAQHEAGINRMPEPSRASRIECAMRQIIEADDGQALTQDLIESGRAALALPAVAQQAPAQAEPGWISVDEQLPDAGYCLATYRNRHSKLRIIRAKYARKFEIDAGDDAIDQGNCDYNDADETHYLKAGWLECVDNWDEYSSMYVTEGEVTHWRPLPPLPGARASTAGERQDGDKS